MHRAILTAAAVLLSAICVVGLSGGQTAKAIPATDDNFPLNYIPSGRAIFQQYCSSCHGAMAKGDGPMVGVLRKLPPDLTTLARRHGGKFPDEYVRAVLEFGPGANSHGTADMPTWGPIFRYYDKANERAVQQRLRNLTNYLASIQE
jgi:mono/diheme cytochrome c family protein